MRQMFRTRILLAASTVLLAAGCALNRSQIKSLRDNDASRIRFNTVTDTTIAALNAIRSHCGPGRNHRVRDEELRVYQVVGRIARVKHEPDHDIHIVLEDPANARERLVVEFDDPDWRGNRASPYRGQLATARRMFDDLVRQAPDHQVQGLMVRVTGVGFFDMAHFQVGRSRSCIELHPILSISPIGAPKVLPRPSFRRGGAGNFRSLLMPTAHGNAALRALTAPAPSATLQLP